MIVRCDVGVDARVRVDMLYQQRHCHIERDNTVFIQHARCGSVKEKLPRDVSLKRVITSFQKAVMWAESHNRHSIHVSLDNIFMPSNFNRNAQ